MAAVVAAATTKRVMAKEWSDSEGGGREQKGKDHHIA
jgi:hypothetical protein